MDQQETIQKEISIKEFIITVWKGKVLIAILTAAAILAGVILSFFILPAQYESVISLKVTPFSIRMSAIDSSVIIVDHLAAIPAMTKADYQALVKSAGVLEDTVKKLDLKDGSGNSLSTASLSDMITVSDVTGTGYITIRVISKEPKQAARIADTISQVFAEYVAANSAAQFQEANTLITQQLTEQETVLMEKRTAFNDFQESNPSLSVLQLTAKNLITQISDNKLTVQNIETQITYDQAALEILRSSSESDDILSVEDYTITIDTNVNTNSVGSNQINVTPDQLQDSLLVIDIYTVWSRLILNLTKVEALNQAIPELESLLTETQILLTDEQIQYDDIASEIGLAKKTLDAYKQRNREAQTYASSDIGGSVVSVMSVATVPGSPVSPNKKLIIGGAGMAAFCLGVCIVLYRKYWMEPTESAPKKRKA
jgi:uncharacterized protein involved in exopolysaccharide biosynthesis